MNLGKTLKGKQYLMIGLAAVGILLLLLGSAGADKRSDKAVLAFSYQEYEEELEKKIEDFCTCVEGIVNVRVFVTLDTSVETRYAQNSTIGSAQSTYEYLLYGTDSVLPIYEIAPVIRGIAVACDGGNDAYVQKLLTELISSATGVPTNKIKIVGYG